MTVYERVNRVFSKILHPDPFEESWKGYLSYNVLLLFLIYLTASPQLPTWTWVAPPEENLWHASGTISHTSFTRNPPYALGSVGKPNIYLYCNLPSGSNNCLEQREAEGMSMAGIYCDVSYAKYSKNETPRLEYNIVLKAKCSNGVLLNYVDQIKSIRLSTMVGNKTGQGDYVGPIFGISFAALEISVLSFFILLINLSASLSIYAAITNQTSRR